MSPAPLPRPEDRRRGDLERLLGCAGPSDIWRSEAFAEDLMAGGPVAPTAARRTRALHNPVAFQPPLRWSFWKA
ncbi:MAG: hypothetical protein Q8R98_16600 [Rubrivivax sp.]|nr:hypothetical protein [Rubrivivax sp.]MDP3225336.1 hypothetical protein [Rubrivivax sp.]MDP3613468.1 hypothetical protein [Rubrivivax sp.]